MPFESAPSSSGNLPPLDSFVRFANLGNDFLSTNSYHLAQAALADGSAYLTTVLDLSAKVDKYLRPQLESKKTGEAHLSPSFLQRLIPTLASLPSMPGLQRQPIQIPNEGPFIDVKYEGSFQPPALGTATKYQATVTVSLAPVPSATITAGFDIVVACVLLDIQPQFDDPTEFPPTDAMAYAKRTKELDLYSTIISVARLPDGTGRTLLSFSFPADPTLPSPFALIVSDGLSLLLYAPNSSSMPRSPRSNTHDYVIEVVADSLISQAGQAAHITNGDPSNDENDYQVADAVNFSVANASQMTFAIHYDFHLFVGGSAGCNWLFCWDTRMWTGVKDNIPVLLTLSAVVTNGTSLQLVISPSAQPYSVPDGAFYYHNMKLIVNLAQLVLHLKDAVKALIDLVVSNRLKNIQAATVAIPFPNLPSNATVNSADAFFDGSGGVTTLRTDVDFSF